MSPRRTVITAGAVLAGLAITGCGDGKRFPTGDARAAVHRFISLSVGQANGQKACGMLTAPLRAKLDDGPSASCRRALSNVTSLLPGERQEATAFEQSTAGMTFDKEQNGDRATVRVHGRGADLTFQLVRLPEGEAPGTDGGDNSTRWRIAGGIDALLGSKGE